jgi:hypothetical protein
VPEPAILHHPGDPVTATRIISPFDFASTAADVVTGIDLRGRRALVTGAASGIGVETARALASAGAETILAARDVTVAEAVAEDLRITTGNRGGLLRAVAHPGQQRRGDGGPDPRAQPRRA